MKTIKQILVIIVALVSASVQCLSATILTGKNITSRDGLLSNQVNDVAQDSNGYIWLGTSSGLSRYDGYSFINFQSIGCGKGATSGNVGTIHIDRKNSLMWIRTATFSYACYDLRKGCFVDYCSECDPTKTFDRFIAEEDGIWMYEAKYGIRHVTYKNGRFSCRDYTPENNTLPRMRFKRVLVDTKGNVWVFTDNGILRHNAKGTFDHLAKGHHFMMGNVWKDRVFFLTDKGVVLIYNLQGRLIKKTYIPQVLASTKIVNGNAVWRDKWVIMTRHEVVTMDCRDFSFEKPEEIQMEYGIPLDRINGNYFISDDKGTLWFFPEKGEVRKFRMLEDTGLLITRKRNFSTAQGRDGRFYIATYGNGLYIYNPTDGSMQHHTANDRQPMLATDYLINIHTDRDGNVWIGQEDAGIVCLQQRMLPETLHLKPENGRQGGKPNFITKFTKNSDGSVTVGTRSNQTYNYEPRTNSIKRVGAEPAVTSKLDSITDRYGQVWIATWEQGLQMKYAGRTHRFLERTTAESRINDIDIDRQGRLWVATFNGLYVVNTAQQNITNDSFMHFGRGDGIANNEINCVMAASDGSVWVGGVGTGAIRCTLHGNRLTVAGISAKRGLANDNIYALTEDANGNIWASSDEVVSLISPKTMKAANYHMKTTFLNDIYSKRCAVTLNDGRVMFGTQDGITIVTPPRTVADAHQPQKAYVTNIDIDGHSVFADERYAGQRNLEEGISLAYDENSLTIYFSSFDYAKPEQSMYQFWMEGLEKQWGEPSTQHSVDYGSLPPGRYVFHLRTAEGGEETILRITIRQPWYNTWWAWVIYLIIAGSLAYAYYRHKREDLRRRQQLAVEKQVAEFRTSFFTQVVHEFRTPLAIISGAVDKMSEESTAMRKPVQTAKRGVRRLSHLVNHLMEFRKVDTGNIRLQVEEGDIVGFVRDIYQDLWTSAQQKEQTLSFLPSEKKYSMLFDRHIIDTVVYNLISNAVKYTPHGGTIAVRLRPGSNTLCIIVEDSGPGIAPERQKELFQPFMHGYASQGGMGIGLYTASRMAHAHKGSLEYGKSESLGGSEFVFTLPATEEAYSPDDYRYSRTMEPEEGDRSAQAEQIILEMMPRALNDIRIAVIEDDPDMLDQIRSEMAVYFNVDAYSTGMDGFSGISNNVPALLVCDVMLPDMNGYDIVKRMKKEPALAGIPVIMLTALGDEQHQIKAYEAGADDYMVKPCNYRILTARAMQLIKWGSIRTVAEDGQKENVQQTTAEETVRDAAQQTTIITSAADKHLQERINSLIAQNIGNPDFNIDQMAEALRMGRTKLYGKVKELTGQSPNKLLAGERMRKAAELLEASDLNISEISYSVGILDASYFNKCFRQYYGTTPSKYRKGKGSS